MSEIKAISKNENDSDDETEGADEVSEAEDNEDSTSRDRSTIQAEIEDDSESLDPRIQVRTLVFALLKYLQFGVQKMKYFLRKN